MVIKNIKINSYQFIWWGYWVGFEYIKFTKHNNYRCLDYSIFLGFFEIRVWLKNDTR